MTLKEKTQRLLDIRKSIAGVEDEYKKVVSPLKEERDRIQEDIMKTLERSDQFSARFDFATVTRAVRKTLVIVDEPVLVQHLKKEGLTDYVSERVNDLFDGVKKEAVKNGIAMPGTEIVESGYISLRESDPDVDRRKVTIE